MFVELPSGEIVNITHIVAIVPLTSGYSRITFVNGLSTDCPEDHAAIIRKAVTKKTK